MPEAYIGEIRLFAFGKTPRGWMACEGQLLQVQQNQALFSLLGAKFGGDGKVTFALPDLRGRVVIGAEQGGGRKPSGGGSYKQGMSGGSEKVALHLTQLPAHVHQIAATTGTAAPFPAEAGNFFGPALKNGSSTAFPIYSDIGSAGDSDWTVLAPNTLSTTGAGDGHDNRQPVLAINFCIAVEGSYPPRS